MRCNVGRVLVLNPPAVCMTCHCPSAAHGTCRLRSSHNTTQEGRCKQALEPRSEHV